MEGLSLLHIICTAWPCLCYATSRYLQGWNRKNYMLIFHISNEVTVRMCKWGWVVRNFFIAKKNEVKCQQVDQLDPSGILVHWCEILGHIISNKQTNKQTGIPRHSQTKVYSRSRSHPEISTRPQVDSRIWFNPHSHATPTTRNTTHLTSLRYTVPHYPHYVNWLLLLNNEFSDFQLSTFHVYKYLHA